MTDDGALYDGFHLDTHPEITEERGPELARLLINLARTPRLLRYAATDRFELASMGVEVDRGDYQVVDLPAGIEQGEVAIPTAANGSVSALCFWASVVPHVGVEEPGGHFLASFEAVAPYDPASP